MGQKMLKEKLIDLLKEKPEQVQMDVFLRRHNNKDGECKTVGCLAGHILLAAGVPVEETPGDDVEVQRVYEINLLYPEPELLGKAAAWISREQETAPGYVYEHDIPGVARYLWAQEYGDEAATKLPFYEEDWKELVCSDDECFFDNLTAKDLIDYLQKAET